MLWNIHVYGQQFWPKFHVWIKQVLKLLRLKSSESDDIPTNI